MLTRTLIAALDRAQEPVAIRSLVWALEKVTGFKTQDIAEQKSIVASFNTVDVGAVSDWRVRHGYPGIDELTGGYADTALQSGAFYACTKIISEDVGSLPFFWYERSADGKRVDKRFDERYRVLHDLANPDTSSGEFREALTSHTILCGNGYAKKEMARSTGKLMWLWQLQPYQVRTDRNAYGQLFYLHKEGNAAEKTYTRDQIFHLKGFTMDGWDGDSILKRARAIIGLTLDAQQYAQRFFSHDAGAGLYLMRPIGAPGLGPEAVLEMKKKWIEWHRGVARSHEPAVLQEGMDVKRLDPDLEKLQMIELRKFQVAEVCRLFRMPPHKLADLDRSTNNNIEWQGIEYVSHTLSPWVRRWREAVHRCLLSREEQIDGRLFAELSVEALQRGDFKTQTDGFARMLDKGVFTVNQVLRFLNLNPVEGGDVNLVQLNMQSLADVGKEIVADEDAVTDAATVPARIPKPKSYVNGAYTA